MITSQNSDKEKLIFVLKYAFPEMEELLPLRFNLLNTVKFNQPIGRRILSTTMGYTERVVRRECDILKDNNLIDYYPDGMRITPKGEDVLGALTDIFYQVNGIHDLEAELSMKLAIKKVIVGSVGIHDQDISLNEIGHEAAKYLSTIINSESIIGLTGGSSIEKVINGYKAEWTHFDHNNIMVVPARGGLGNRNEYQANTLVEILSGKLKARYQMLYTQDNLSKATIEELKNEPNIRRILEYIDRLDVLVFGVGRADVMATRRVLDESEIENIKGKGAVAESFGYYFNKDGEIVHEISTIGIDLDKFKALKNVIAVAGGIDKAESIIAISKLNPNLVLVTDELTAKKINELL